MALFPSGSHRVSGRVLWAWRRAEVGLTLIVGRVRNGFCKPGKNVWFSLKHGTSLIMVFKMSFALYKFMEKDHMLKSLKANFVLNTKVLL